MPQHYPGNITYQKDNKFTPISIRNITDYNIIHDDGDFVYMVDSGQTTGYVFDINDLQKRNQHVLPVMRVSLRDTPIKGYKQAFHLRIREAYSKNNITSNWYDNYVKHYGGIVSDCEHLEGGKQLWKSFIKKAPNNVYLYDLATNEQIPIASEMNDEDIWSKDSTKKNLVIVFDIN